MSAHDLLGDDRYRVRSWEHRCLVRVHDTLQRGEQDASLNAAVIASALSEIESGGFA